MNKKGPSMFNPPCGSRTLVLSLFAGLLALSPVARAQLLDPGDPDPSRGLAPTGTYRIEDIETVNPATGAVLLSIPLAQLPTNRGGDPGFGLKLTYNSTIYDVLPGYGNHDQNGNPVLTNTLGMDNGWTYNTQYNIEFTDRPGATFPCPTDNAELQYFYRMTLVLPDGSRHMLRLSGQDVANQTEDGYYQYQPNGVAAIHCGSQQSPPLTGVLTYYTADGTFLNLAINTATCSANFNAGGACPWTLYYPDGSSVTQQTLPAGNATLLSRTGNSTTIAQAYAGGIWTTTIADNASRSITLQQSYLGEPLAGGVTDTITISGVYGHTVQTSVAWRALSMPSRNYLCAPTGYPNSGGAVGGQDCQLGPGGSTPITFPEIGSITLPVQLCDSASPPCGLGYVFTYDTDNGGSGVGEMSAVTTPLGSNTAYHYLMDANGTTISGWSAYSRNSISRRTISPDLNDPYTFPAETTTYVFANATQSTVTAPDGGVTTYYFFQNPASVTPPPNGGLIYKIILPDGTIDERYWLNNNPAGFPANSNPAIVFNNPYINTGYRTIAGQAAITNYQYDQNGNVLQFSEYGWSNASGIPRTQDQYQSPIGVPGGLTQVRTTVSQYYYAASSYPYSKPAGSAPIWRAAPSSVGVRAGGATGTQYGLTQYAYAAVNPSLSTSLMKATQFNWDSVKAPSPTYPLSLTEASVTGYTYDNYGNLTYVKEAGRSDSDRTIDQYVYDTTGTLLQQAIRAAGTNQTTTTTYVRDPSTGLVTNSVPDTVNNIPVQTTYDDLGRPTLIQEAYQLQQQRQTAIQYSVQQRRIITQKDKNQNADGALISVQYFDSRGRLWRARTLENGSIGSATSDTSSSSILTDTQYYSSSAGHCTIVSNPYRAAAMSDPTVGWTLTDLDTMGRPIKVWGLSGSAAPSCGNAGGSISTGYSLTKYNQWATVGANSGVMTQFTDESSKVRQSVADGLGRIVGVVEDPSVLNYQTSYGYDVLDDLTAVVQGAESRSFVYDSLKRLTSSDQPEMNPSGTGPTLAASYTYTNDGLVLTRTDGDGEVTTYSYDPLNRPTETTYTNSGVTPTVTYCYGGAVTNGDGQCTTPPQAILLSHGRLTEMRASETLSGKSMVSLTRNTGFDELGRIIGSQQTTNAWGPYVFSYSYDLAGALTEESYPSGRLVTTAYDFAERPTSLSGTFGQMSTPYGGSGGYTASGALQSLVLGNGLTEEWLYNSRLQATNVGVGSGFALTLTYPATTNNGNLSSQTIARSSSTWTQSYSTYDGVNRLQSAAETGGASPEWSQSYGYDQFGNRWVSANASPGFSLNPFTPVGSANYDGGNHLVIQGQSVVYDLAGRQTQLGAYQSAYDAEGRMQSSTISGAATSYVYDADGRRVMKQAGSGSTVYVYDASGLLTAEYTTGSTAVLCGTCYVTPDHLGSTRLVTDAAANAVGCHDYLPSGEEIPTGLGGRSGSCWDAADITEKFTGKERDAETGLDNFIARYYSGAQGRFASPDQPLVDQEADDPQGWNLYSYVRNNPLRFRDSYGRTCVAVTDSSGSTTGYKDVEGPGGTCADAYLGDIQEGKKPSTTVTAQAPPSPELLAVAQGAQQAGPVVEAAAWATLGVTGGGMLGGALIGGGGLTTLGAIEATGASTEIGTGSTAVYQSVNAASEVQYVGITNNLARRAAEHAARFAIQRIAGLSNLTRVDAKAVEQVLIEYFQLGKNGGTLLNQINSIAQSNPVYAQAIQRGIQILKSVGYPGF
jgi:RHS repeat-associated protein